jgi:hypothetical protein
VAQAASAEAWAAVKEAWAASTQAWMSAQTGASVPEDCAHTLKAKRKMQMTTSVRFKITPLLDIEINRQEKMT